MKDKPTPIGVEKIGNILDLVSAELEGRKPRLLRTSRCNDKEFKLVIVYE